MNLVRLKYSFSLPYLAKRNDRFFCFNTVSAGGVSEMRKFSVAVPERVFPFD